MILHIDMDAFFASVEQRDRPELRGRPVVVGGSSRRSVVAAASYEARTYGIRSAMPMFQALERCPDVIVVPPDRDRYRRVSGQVMAILDTISPRVEPVSIDEAFLDISGCERLHGDPLATARTIKRKILEAVDLTCSVGGAPLRFLAKIASDQKKPDGITIIMPEDVEAFARSIPIEKIPGVGRRTLEQLRPLGIRTLGDVTRLNEALLVNKIGKFGSRLAAFARCVDDSVIGSDDPRKSISTETTLVQDIAGMESLKPHFLAQSQEVGRMLRKQHLFAGTIFIKLKFTDFSSISRQKTLEQPVSSSTAIFEAAMELAGRVLLRKKIRLVGLGVSSLSDRLRSCQLDLFGSKLSPGEREERWCRVDSAVDAIVERFGTRSVSKAALNRSQKGENENFPS